MASRQSALATLLALATQVAAHGHVTNVVVNGVSYEGWDTDVFPYIPDYPKVAAWGTPNNANGYIPPSEYTSPDIICHRNATNGEGHIVIAAGDKINLQWIPWPESHHGPVLDYLARCNGPCETVDKTSLEFFKISEVGQTDDSDVPGIWGNDLLIANNNSWMVQIPKSIEPGNYVLRHELVALHGAYDKEGAQNYPQCINLQVTGSGTNRPVGVPATELYTPEDTGILVDIWNVIESGYMIPGPTLYSGATPIVSQSSSTITSSASPVVPTGTPTWTATILPVTPSSTPSHPPSSSPSGSPNPSSSPSVSPSPSSTPTAVPTFTILPITDSY